AGAGLGEEEFEAANNFLFMCEVVHPSPDTKNAIESRGPDRPWRSVSCVRSWLLRSYRRLRLPRLGQCRCCPGPGMLRRQCKRPVALPTEGGCVMRCPGRIGSR